MTKPLKRRSYDQRSRSNTPAAKILAEAVCRKIEYSVDRNGDRVRTWRKDELQTYKNDDIARAVSRRRALEYSDLLEDIPPTAVKYALTKQWLVLSGGFYFVTEKAAAELKLPKRTFDGMTIRFARAA